MGQHHHSVKPWRVRVDDAEGNPHGAGVLLDDRHVLTCAHVVGLTGAAPGGSIDHLRITSVACNPEWTRTARVAPGSWVHEGDTQRGDVALLQLDEPAGCGTRTALWRAPLSGVTVSAYGFPQASRMIGMGTDAELSGFSGGRDGWALLNLVRPGSPWIEQGYSGAGVVVKDGEFKDRVIGIVVADYIDGEARAAWMLPTESIAVHLPQIKSFTDGGWGNRMQSIDEKWPNGVLDDALQLALTRELTRLLGGTWAGTAVVGTGNATGAGTSWLVRLVRTADPAARAVLSDDELTGAPGDTVLGLGAIDAAYDARGRTVAEVTGYLVDRFGLAGGEDRNIVSQLLRRRPPACLVVGSIDQAEDPEGLIRHLLGPLAARARSRGIRLVLGFESKPPADLSYDVFLDPERLAEAVPGDVTAEETEEAVGQLTAAEDAAVRLQAEWGMSFFAVSRLPPAAAPRLRVRRQAAASTRRRTTSPIQLAAGPPRKTRRSGCKLNGGCRSSPCRGCRLPPRPAYGCGWLSPAAVHRTRNSPRSTPTLPQPTRRSPVTSTTCGARSPDLRTYARRWSCTAYGPPGTSATRIGNSATSTRPRSARCRPRRST
ncbi:serine protease [Streptomyces sp. TM32]|uniref:S1 family peptidase n=1 Tax=Streptomyces sp. TM32 TaxID=1652669 RepID=UPI001387648E|nr:serine protease [Streptomyces sp. TM32]